MDKVQGLKIPLEDIVVATKNFHKENFIAKGGFGSVYKGKLRSSDGDTEVAVKRLDPESEQGKHEFMMEITTLSSYRHKNLVCLVGFCDVGTEKILVYEHESKGSLDRYIHNADELNWMKRLKISIGAARGINYLHDEVGQQHRVLHRDIKSANILLSKDWDAKVADFGLSKIGPANVQYTFLVTAAAGTFGYLDPVYYNTGVLTKESDVYSFGVVLFEILCGRLAYEEGMFLGPLAERMYNEDKLDEIIHPKLRKEMKTNALNTFTAIAYQCLKSDRSQRPKMSRVVEKLENAYEIQASLITAEFTRVGIWGTTSSEGPLNRWAFLIQKDHKLKMITIDHGDLIYSLMITTESKGIMYTSSKAGGWNGGDTVSEVIFDDDEELIGINGTVGKTGRYTIISSLSFVTNKNIHGPFGQATDNLFSVPWKKGNFGGLAGYYIDGIGVYMKASSNEITQVGVWGSQSPGSPQNQWSFQLERHHHLKKITIDHGDLIYSLMFTTEFRGLEQTSDKAGGWNGGDTVSEVTFAWDEDIIAISGTVGVSGGTHAGYTIISSLTFITNKKTHGPYGSVTGTPFTVPWDKEALAGFYGRAGYYIDAIGAKCKESNTLIILL